MHDTKEVSTIKQEISNSWGFDMQHLLQVSSLIKTTRNFVYIGAYPGRFRWREPQQPPKVSGIQQADNQPNMCWQAGDGSAPVTPFPTHNEHPQKRASPPSSEDCLFLKFVFHRRLNIRYKLTRHTSIATPVAGNGSLPVVVWIHGFVISYLNHR